MEEVEKLLATGFIQEVYYPEWLANVVMVKKSNGKWHMCVDFIDLNYAYPKDNFSLPRIDQLVDSTASYELLTFMDAFLGYNQIPMNKEDQEKIAFVTSQGLYGYRVMSFGLKNSGATYERLVNQIFCKQIGRNMEVYVDDMLVKSKNKAASRRPQGDFLYIKEVSNEVKPNKVCVRSFFWQDFRVHGLAAVYRG